MKKFKLGNTVITLLLYITIALFLVDGILILKFIKDFNEAGTETIEVSYSDNAPDYFLEPEGYQIAEITYSNLVESGTVYGYISNKDYRGYQKGTTQTILVKDPYDENGFTKAITCVSVKSITLGIYKDMRVNYKLNKVN